MKRRAVFWIACGLGVVLPLLVACNRDGVSPAVSRGVNEMKPGPIVYVALGDSTGSGVGARNGGYVARLFRRLLEHRAGSELANLCVSGATTEDVLRSQLQNGVGKSPDLVTLGIGINDIGHGFTIEQFTKNYDQILSTLKEKTTAEILVTNIPDVSSAPRIPNWMRAEYQRQIEQFNQRLEEIAQRHNVTIFDVFTVTRRELPSHPEYFSGDGFHPSDEGYELWAEQMWPTMAGVIGAPE
ncbi:MAG TPA: SGNH/GDSL hydrolase family protein [Pyrinomonadaceae bacterium]|nr:SGNH/GDSL hydrolase family protein [Pyrinomonadaceae bacterium]